MVILPPHCFAMGFSSQRRRKSASGESSIGPGSPHRQSRIASRRRTLSFGEVDHIAINQNNWANLAGKLRYLISHRPDFSLVLERVRNRRARSSLPQLLAASFPGDTFLWKDSSR